MQYAHFVKEQREKRGLGHDEIAEMLGISRSSYFAIERGDKKLKLEEAIILAKIFGITVDDLITAFTPDLNKYRQMILAFLRKAKESGETIKKTKLAKLLYFADFASYYFNNKSMSGLAYRKIEFGPVPDVYFRILDELAEEEKIDIHKVVDGERTMFEISETFVSEIEKLDLLSEKENNLIENIWKKWQKASTNQIVQYTHNQNPYKSVEYGQIVPYELIKEERKEFVY
jgi:DNA-binding XRE family transcriptional regulator/uncharacterized phage-associated protein